MSHMSASALLSSARDLIARIPSWRVTASDRSAATALLDDIDRWLSDRTLTVVPGNLIEAVRAQWRDLTDVEIDTDAMTRHDERGAWVRAWLLAQSASFPLDPDRFCDALGSLPLMAREVYRLHRIEGQSLAETGRQLGLDPAVTEAQLFGALRGLHEMLYPRR